jgi:hypothetical protein
MMAHDDEDGGNHGEFADKIVIYPADDEKHQASTDRQARHHEKDCANDALRQGDWFDRSVQGKAEDDRYNDPADAVIDDGRGKDYLADDTAHEIHLAHDHRHDLDRCDRKRRSKK